METYTSEAKCRKVWSLIYLSSEDIHIIFNVCCRTALFLTKCMHLEQFYYSCVR